MVRPASGAGEIRSGYLHLQFPRVDLAAVLGLVDVALGEQGWLPGEAPNRGARAGDGRRSYHQSWRHPTAPVWLARAAIAFHPVAVTIGRERIGPPFSPGRRLLRGTLLYLVRRARSLGGVPLSDAALPRFHADAQRRVAQATAIAFELEQLTFALQHRRCPRCGRWGEPRQRWCWACQYEFTGEEDHVADAAAAAARQRIDWLRAQRPDEPAGRPPAAPPLSALGLGGPA
ncbi:hypothetical protein ABGB07_14245 [Micromonosporaceae bacterium B7E4]